MPEPITVESEDVPYDRYDILPFAIEAVGSALQWDAQMINSAFQNQSDDYAVFLANLVIDIGNALEAWVNEEDKLGDLESIARDTMPSRFPQD